MHIPDGFFDAPTSVGAGAATAVTLAASVTRSTVELAERHAPLAGLVAAFVFALQMLTFPVAAGTSGHLLGGALAAVLVGPWLGTLCVAVVLFVQAMVFADGGITAYGINVLLVAVIPAFVGYGVFVMVRAVAPPTRSAVVAAAAAGAFVSVPVAAAAFAGLYAVGGTVDLAMSSVLVAMVGVHSAIGIGEAVITATVVSAVVATRPDLVHGAADLAPGGRPTDSSAVAGTAAP